MAEDKAVLPLEFATTFQIVQVSIKGNLAQHYNHLHAFQRGKFTVKIRGAGGDLLRRGFVSGWSTADSSGDVGVKQAQAVSAVRGVGLGGESRLVQHGIEKV